MKSYYDYVEWGNANIELDGIISRYYLGDSFFIFVLIIAFYEMTTKPSWIKITIRVFLVFIILGTQFSTLIPIKDFYFGTYNTAWFAATVAFVLLLFRIGKYAIEKNKNRKSKRT